MKKPHLNIGINKEIAFVFSAPGKKEEQNLMPLSGQTGTNLKTILTTLGYDSNLEYYTITNSIDKVFPNENTNRTEATIKEILNVENIERLLNELKDTTKYIFFFGQNARAVSLYLTSLNAKFICCPHLSPKAMSHIRIDGNEKDKSQKKLILLSEYIKKQM